MRSLTVRANCFFSGIIPEEYKQKAKPHYILPIAAIGAALISLLGIKSLAVLPGIIFVYAAFRFPMFLLYLFLASIPVTMYFFGGIHRIYSYSLVLLMIALWFCRKMLSADSKIDYSKFMIGFIALFSFAMVCSAFNNGVTRMELVSIIRYLVFFPFMLVLYDIYKPKSAIPVVISITIPFVISTFYLFSAYLRVGNFMEFLDIFRMKPAGIFGNANAFGGRALFVAPFWIALAIWSKNKYLRAISALLALALTSAIILTNSRAAMFGVLFIAVFYFIIAKKIKYFIVISALVLVTYMVSPFLRDLTSIALRLERGTTGRVAIWNNSYDLIKKNIFLGVGVGNYATSYESYLQTAFQKGFFGSVMVHAHNEALHMTTELGILGLLLILALFYVPFKKGFTLMKKSLVGDDRAIVYGLMGILFANLGNSFFSAVTMLAAGGLYPPILYWITMIMILRLDEKYKRRGIESLLRIPRTIL